MRFLHLSDLHLGKRLNEFSLIEDQKYILNAILSIAEEEKVQAVLMAGDIYDKSVPSAEAVQVFDDFLYALAQKKLQVFIISGNHDSPERIAFGGRLMGQSGIHLSPVYDGTLLPITLSDEFGDLDVYMLPFIKPVSVRRYYPDEKIESYTDAVRSALSHAQSVGENRKILITHQFVTGAIRSDSEEFSVGGTDNVDASVFDGFDYVALGHIHAPQTVGKDTVRYCGTPLKYSFSERDQLKSVSIVDVLEKGEVKITLKPLKAKHDLRRIKGSYDQLTLKENYITTAVDDYLDVVLTDEEDVPNAIERLRFIYPNVMHLSYDNTRTRATANFDGIENVERRTEMELLSDFYKKQNGQDLSEEQRTCAEQIFKKLKGEEI